MEQKLFPYDYAGGWIVVYPAETPMVRRSAGGTLDEEGGHPEIRPTYCTDFAERGMSMEFARSAWRRFFADGTDFTAIPTLAEQDAFTDSMQRESDAISGENLDNSEMKSLVQ